MAPLRPKVARRIFALTGVIGLLAGWGFVGLELWERREVARYVPVEATVLEARVDSYSDSCGRDSTRSCTFYTPAVRYAYQVDGTRYQSTTLDDLGSSSSDDRSDEEERLAEVVHGGYATAWVDPLNPANAFLHRTHHLRIALIALLVSGAWGALWLSIARWAV